MIRLCLTPCWGHDINDENCVINESIKDRFFKWRSLTNKLWLWTYPNNHTWYVAYTPLLKGLQSHMKFFAENKISGLFLEYCDINGRIGPFYEIKQYFLARLAWNPYIDLETEYKEMMEYIYEDSAPYLMEIEKRYQENCEKTGYHFYNSNTINKKDFVDDFFVVAEQLYEIALRKAKTARLKLRIRIEYIYFKFNRMYLRRDESYPEIQEVLDEMEELEIFDPKIEMFREHYFGGMIRDDFLRSIEERNDKLEMKMFQELKEKLQRKKI